MSTRTSIWTDNVRGDKTSNKFDVLSYDKTFVIVSFAVKINSTYGKVRRSLSERMGRDLILYADGELILDDDIISNHYGKIISTNFKR